jgi:signal transduction histidine kinase
MVARVFWLRAVIEAALVAAVLTIVLLAVVPAQNTELVWRALGLGFFDIGVVAGVLAAVRARRSTGPGRARAFGREVGLLVVTVVAVVLSMTTANAIAHTFRPALDTIAPTWIPHSGFGVGGVLTFVAAGAGGSAALLSFAVTRPIVVLWPRWDRLRRSRLVWSITHAQLLASMAIAVAVGTVVLTWFLIGGRGPLTSGEPVLQDPLVRVQVGFIAAVTGAFVLVGLATVTVLPLAAIVSYLALRPTTRRLDELTAATGALREGDLTARVAIDGEDEVAHLQADFNAMAADLERSVGELEAERDTVSELLAARRELVTAVSHELRTPVATIRAYLDSSREHWNGAPADRLRRDLAVMANEAERLQRLIEDLFTLSRAEVGGLPMTVGAVAVEPVLARSVAAVRPLARDRSRVELVMDVSPDLPPVMADEGRLEQIVRNLIANAVRHTRPGGVVRATADVTGPMVAVRVEDTGEGIAPGELERIWERFYRTDDARDRDRGGAGLGLALVKELVEAMGGRVEVESTLGIGSRFSVYLPVASETGDSAAVPAATGLRHTDDRAATRR